MYKPEGIRRSVRIVALVALFFAAQMAGASHHDDAEAAQRRHKTPPVQEVDMPVTTPSKRPEWFRRGPVKHKSRVVLHPQPDLGSPHSSLS